MVEPSWSREGREGQAWVDVDLVLLRSGPGLGSGLNSGSKAASPRGPDPGISSAEPDPILADVGPNSGAPGSTLSLPKSPVFLSVKKPECTDP